MRSAVLSPVLAMLAILGADPVGASAQEPSKPPDPSKRPLQDGARPEQHDLMLADKNGTYGPADGGGSARLVESTQCMVGEKSRFVLEYAAGPLGIAVGGQVFLQVSPFWGWSTPQVVSSDALGYTEVTTSRADVKLALETVGPQCLAVRIGGAPLREGDTVRFVYGAGVGAEVDRFAEREESFYFWVDGDGDGTRKLIASDPHVDVAAAAPRDLVVTIPSEVAVGAGFPITLAFLDVAANAAPGFVGEVALEGDGLELPKSVEFKAEDLGRKRVSAKAPTAGVRHVLARFGERVRESNPMLVSPTPRLVLWADLHGHSQLSDGTGTPDDYYTYARDVAGLDVAALTDHDHWGMRKLDTTPEMWRRIVDATRKNHEPGKFVTLLGYEWTNWLYGHRHVLYFEDEGPLLSSLDAPTDTPEGLWQALRGRKAITVPHHPAGGPVPVDWSIPPDPELEPVVEISSVHGTSEERGGPHCIYDARDGHFVRDALARGYRLGILGSGDTHNGHPGHAHVDAPNGGLAAILADECTRDGVYRALRARTCFATSGPRILLWFKLGEGRATTRLGGVAKEPARDAPAGEQPAYFGFAIGTAPIRRLEFVKNGSIAQRQEGKGTLDLDCSWRDPNRKKGDCVYLRVVQEDGHAAWSSPIFTE